MSEAVAREGDLMPGEPVSRPIRLKEAREQAEDITARARKAADMIRRWEHGLPLPQLYDRQRGY